MFGFVSSLPLTSFRISAAKCERRKHFTQAQVGATKLRMATSSNETEEDDDATMGSTGPIYGLQIPDMTPQEKAWLDEAPNNDEFMIRMRKIARRLENDRQRAMGGSRKTPTADYMKSLSGQ